MLQARGPLGSCDVIWDGVDFSPCFREKFFSNWPIILTALSIAYFLVTRLARLILPSTPTYVTSSTLTSPTGDSNLSKLESDVIISALASNLLPLDPSGKRISPSEAAEDIQDFKNAEPKDIKRWRRVKYWVGIVGGLAYAGTAIAEAVITKQWKQLVFPIYIVLIAPLPRLPITPVLTLHLVSSLIVLRSTVIDGHVRPMAIAPTVVELAYWSALIAIPYGATMDRLLQGSHSQGGGSLGSFGTNLLKHIEEPTSALSRATYIFMLPFLVKYFRKPITLEEIPALREDDSSAATLGAFRADQAYWDARYAAKHGGAKRHRNLGLNLARFFARDIARQSAWACLFICLQYLPPTGLRLLLQYVKNRQVSDQPTHVAFVYVGMMAFGQCAGIMAMAQCLYLGRRVCVRIRAIIIAEVFTKALRRRDVAGAVKKTVGKDGKVVETAGANDGKVANLVSNDAFAVSEVCAYTYYLVSCPFAVIINSVLLFNTLGIASLAGMAVIVLFIPMQALTGRIYAITQRKLMAATDARLETVTEAIAHIKLIKFNAWESKFFDRMGATRKQELQALLRKFAISTVQQVLIWGMPAIVASAAFAVHSVALKQPLTADAAFASLILFNMLRDPLALFQDTFSRLLQAYTSCSRIQEYLEEPDTLKYEQLSKPGPEDPKIGFKGAVLGYHTHDEIKDAEFAPFRLGPLDLSFPVGSLSIIVGSVGSGKTTLVSSLLGETTLLEGKIFMPDDKANRDVCPVDPVTGLADTVAYCSQTPWLVGASIRENITFGSSWDEGRYNAVVDACALRRDFEIFELGDETEVGEKGTTCSGGQKARIALARALYSSAATIILDDVLSAVDAQTARHLYVNCLQGPLMSGRTVILVTHQVSLVAPAASLVVMLDAGNVVAAGTPAELMASGQLEMLEEVDTGASSSTPTLTGSPKDIIEDNFDRTEAETEEMQKKIKADKAAPETQKLAKQLVATESQGQGMIGMDTYMLYFRSMGGIVYWVILWTALIAAQILQVGSNAWIKDWANSFDSARSIRATLQSWTQGHGTTYYLLIYMAISAVYLFSVAARCGWNYLGSLHASRKLWDRLLYRILGAKMRFFDATPSGRIINRLSKDMFSIDNEAGEILMYFANCVLSVVSVLFVIVFSTPMFIFALIVIATLYFIIGSLYVVTNREIKRFDSVTRSPIFISFSEALVGMSTIRSYGDSARFLRKVFDELDQNTRCFWYLWQANRVLHNFSNFIGSFVTIFACVFALQNPAMDAGAVGLSISYALSFTDHVLWIVRMYAACEMSMNSVERVGEYLDLEVEEETHKRGVEPPAYWPSRDSKVIVDNLTCKYAPQLEPVLRGVSFEIAPREKIGICGRTGSGKSTLALSFFRFLHQEEGSIVIDGLDISKISLSTLRSRLTILPQEAQLFSGTIRDNLDPFNEHEDADIWDALIRCGLAGKTPFASGNPSRRGSKAPTRIQSKVDLNALNSADHGVAGADVRIDLSDVGRTRDEDEALVHLEAAQVADVAGRLLERNEDLEVVKVFNENGEEEEVGSEVEERVTIRSLEEKVAVGGKNFSQGQRQLLALARGLLKLRSSSFLIMDESTANLDHATDQTIQHVLRTSLKDTQMLVIAHRLMTVCGLDKILVLDHGKVVEFGTPWELLQDESGVFRDLCRQSGEETQLVELAKSVHEAKTSGVRDKGLA